MGKRLYKLHSTLYEKLVLLLVAVFRAIPKGDEQAKIVWGMTADRIFKRVRPKDRSGLSGYDKLRLLARETGLRGPELYAYVMERFPRNHDVAQACMKPVHISLEGYDPDDPGLPNDTRVSHLATWLIHQYPTLEDGGALHAAELILELSGCSRCPMGNCEPH